ncbi:uncharacterized protein LOC102803361 [Saccoglossus kowalevskii]|uniref:Uncharacterized protein LOC102803361 n=1 Tax=Saccoglossus kowalevskii TaxID=10224 RepID=A0ABM0MTL9_SACKO|nr:PREDICTED: uncharacterized protein LOC102803361 [Saccoglossus kowalevskii]
MSLVRWLKKVNSPRTPGLPDPNLCTTEEEATSTQAANDQIDQLVATSSTRRKRKRGQYSFYNAETRAKIAKSSIEIGVMKTSRKFSKELNINVNESTVRYGKP